VIIFKQLHKYIGMACSLLLPWISVNAKGHLTAILCVRVADLQLTNSMINDTISLHKYMKMVQFASSLDMETKQPFSF